jgi:hypothetical protein
LKALNAKDPAYHEEYLSAVLKVMLKRIYAGDEGEAWRFFDAEYQLNDKVEIKTDIKQALRHDPIYRSMIFSPALARRTMSASHGSLISNA